MTGRLCTRCGAGLGGDEIALYRKMVSREAQEFLCLDCQASDCGATREKLQRLIDYFHRTGICTLFAKYD
ncbi:MAG: hypothetical protein IJR48_02660 [Oscillibacter sp.]|nr:hypothetical protein [Oscillibacter sp.]MBQ7680977.1 hypothetical protein [Oscillibacter sp.]MBQ9617241.1 hypothetical protein [Oscillibacter sp.]